MVLQGTVAGEALREARVASVAREAMVAAMMLVIEAPMVRLTSTVAPVVSPPFEKTGGAEVSMMERTAPVEVAVAFTEALAAVPSQVATPDAVMVAEKTIEVYV